MSPAGENPRAWRVVGALFVMLAFSSGFGFYNQSVLIGALTAERGFSVSQVSLATTIFFFVSGVAGLGVAALLQRFDARVPIVGGVLICALSLTLLGEARTLTSVYLVFAIFGVGFAGSGLVAGTTLVARWFEERRSTALAITTTGLSVGGMFIAPLSARLVQELGLEGGGRVMAVLYLVAVVPLVLIVVRDSPAPASGGVSGAGGSGPGLASVRFGDAVRSRFFLFLTTSYVLAMMSQVGGIAHQFKLVSEGAGAAVAATAVSVLSAGSIVGRLITGWLTQRISSRGLTVTLMSLQGLTLTALGQAEGRSQLLLGSGAFGLTVGSVLLMQPLLLASSFGVAHYPRIYSVGSLVSGVGVSLGALVLGLVYDLSGGYAASYAVAGALSLAAAVVLSLSGTSDAPRQRAVADGDALASDGTAWAAAGSTEGAIGYAAAPSERDATSRS